ncbi:histidinol-phosphatase [Celeribacter indicus]|uniref:Histidinol-phosphatase n=1 Tax=Celeribacter indicus TaxID=1208324 RepID=A0A0B5DYJ9_9RHOB|nr:histidinol-phosphatase [Celeribacter indicus]AJE46240.1 putative inositol-1-monophosphatase [Celeribacter indicus]SDW50837.1 histidinol-phosphatase, inositol monophosphatase family [Celeribacter indicus]
MTAQTSFPDFAPALRAELIATAQAAADAARQVTLGYFRGAQLGTESKMAAGFDPVTLADRGAEQAMRAVIAARRPEDGILGEEFGPKEGRTGLTWVLDPIDGTRGFISGTPTWGVLVALRGPEGALLGVIDQPYIGERFLGGFGLARLDGPHGSRPLRVRTGVGLDEAVIFTTFPEVGSPAEGRAFHDLARRCRLTRYGMDCYAYALLAAGQIDLVVEAGLQSYDILAPLAVIEAAGGIVTDWRGGPAHDGGRVIAAASPELHAAALEILSLA